MNVGSELPFEVLDRTRFEAEAARKPARLGETVGFGRKGRMFR